MANHSKLSNKHVTSLMSEQQIDAVKCIYARGIDPRSFGTTFPALSHQKKAILGYG